ncbi:MAG: hypothetical protein WKF31_09120 [Thermoleophilaceae bacterium]
MEDASEEVGEPPGRWAAWRARRHARAEAARERRAANRIGTCAAPRCWGRTTPGGQYCPLHQRL